MCPHCGAPHRQFYHEYVLWDSPAWQDLKQRAFVWWGRFCSLCGATEAELTPGCYLEIHHLTYKRLGHEKLCDVRPVCSRCHSVADAARIGGQSLSFIVQVPAPRASKQLDLFPIFPVWANDVDRLRAWWRDHTPDHGEA